MDKWPHNRCASHGHLGILPKPGKRKAIQLNEGQADGRRPYTMNRELSLRESGGDDNRGQRHGETPSGSRGSAGLTCVTDSIRDLHLWNDQMGPRVCLRRRAVFYGRSRMRANWKPCESGRHDTREMGREEHCVGK